MQGWCNFKYLGNWFKLLGWCNFKYVENCLKLKQPSKATTLNTAFTLLYSTNSEISLLKKQLIFRRGGRGVIFLLDNLSWEGGGSPPKIVMNPS